MQFTSPVIPLIFDAVFPTSVTRSCRNPPDSGESVGEVRYWYCNTVLILYEYR